MTKYKKVQFLAHSTDLSYLFKEMLKVSFTNKTYTSALQ